MLAHRQAKSRPCLKSRLPGRSPIIRSLGKGSSAALANARTAAGGSTASDRRTSPGHGPGAENTARTPGRNPVHRRGGPGRPWPRASAAWFPVTAHHRPGVGSARLVAGLQFVPRYLFDLRVTLSIVSTTWACALSVHGRVRRLPSRCRPALSAPNRRLVGPLGFRGLKISSSALPDRLMSTTRWSKPIRPET